MFVSAVAGLPVLFRHGWMVLGLLLARKRDSRMRFGSNLGSRDYQPSRSWTT